ncbi:MAG: hypothetical protein ABIH23_19835 [bacterium]
MEKQDSIPGRIFSRLGKRGRKFLLVFGALLVGLYGLSYLVVLWFLISARGQAWIEQTLSSRLGVLAQWEGATVSPFLQPSLQNVTVEITSNDGSSRRLSADEMVFQWSVFSEGGVSLNNVHSISGLAEGLEIQVANLDVEWKRLDGKPRLSLDINEPDIEVSAGGTESERSLEEKGTQKDFQLDDLNNTIDAVGDFAKTTLGRLTVSDGRIRIVFGNDVVELQNVSIERDLSVENLRLTGEAMAQDETTINVDLTVPDKTSVDATPRIVVTTPSLGWLPESLLPISILKDFLIRVSISVSSAEGGPLEIEAQFGSPPAFVTLRTPSEPTPGAISLSVSSLSPLSATAAFTLRDLSLSQLVPDFSAGIGSASGSIIYSGSETGEIDFAVTLDHVRYASADLQVDIPKAQAELKTIVNPRTGLENGTLDLFISPSRLRANNEEVDVPELSIAAENLNVRDWSEVSAGQIILQIAGGGRIEGNLIASVSPSLNIGGTVETQQLPLALLWPFYGEFPIGLSAPEGIADVTCSFQIAAQETHLRTYARISDFTVPSATFSAAHLEIDGQVSLAEHESFTSSFSVSANHPSWEDVTVPHASISAQLSRSGRFAPISISDIIASCNLFSATGSTELRLDEQGLYAATYDTTIYLYDLSEIYSTADNLLKDVQLDGLDVGGQATVCLKGGWTQGESLKGSVQADVLGSRLLAKVREIPVQWKSLDASLSLDTRISDFDSITGIFDLLYGFQIDPQETHFIAHARFSGFDVPSATFEASHLEIDTQTVFGGREALAGSILISVLNSSWENFVVPQASISANIYRLDEAAPISFSDISVSSNLFSATGSTELTLDNHGPQSLTYDTTIRLEDLSETYSISSDLLKSIGLDGLDVGGRATVRLKGGWIRSGPLKSSAQAELFGNRVLADTREIPVQWDGLNAHLTLESLITPENLITARAEGTLSDFVTLAGNYDLDATGKTVAFDVDGIWNPSAQSLNLNSLNLRCPGMLEGQAQGSVSADGYNLSATITDSNMADSYRDVYKDLLMDRWPDAANMAVDGSAQIQIHVDNGPDGMQADGSIHLANGGASLGDEAHLGGVFVDLSAGLTRRVSAADQIEPRQPMQLEAGLIKWGSNEMRDIYIWPHIADGSLSWEEEISIPLREGDVRIGPVTIAQPFSANRRAHTSVHFRQVELKSESESDDKDILQTLSEAIAELPEVTINKNVLNATGTLSLNIFGGLATISRITVWQFLSPYPIWGGDIEFQHMDLSQICAWLNLGRIEGRVSGSLRELQLSLAEGIKPMSFDLDVENDPGGGVISREALKMIFDMGQQASTKLLLDRSEYAYGRLGLRAKLDQDHFFLWGKFKDGDMYYFMEPPSLLSRILPMQFHTVRIALNDPNRELSFDDVWNRISSQSFDRPEIKISFLKRINPLQRLNPF